MAYYYIRTGMLGSVGDVFKAKDADTAALRAAQKWPRAGRLHVFEINEVYKYQYLVETDVKVTGVERI